MPNKVVRPFSSLSREALFMLHDGPPDFWGTVFVKKGETEAWTADDLTTALRGLTLGSPVYRVYTHDTPIFQTLNVGDHFRRIVPEDMVASRMQKTGALTASSRVNTNTPVEPQAPVELLLSPDRFVPDHSLQNMRRVGACIVEARVLGLPEAVNRVAFAASPIGYWWHTIDVGQTFLEAGHGSRVWVKISDTEAYSFEQPGVRLTIQGRRIIRPCRLPI